MIRLTDLRGLNITPGSVASFVPRVSLGSSDVHEVVEELLHAVRQGGLSALVEQAAKFDGVDNLDPRIGSRELSQALRNWTKP